MNKAIKIFLAVMLISAFSMLSACGNQKEISDEIITKLIDEDLKISKYLYFEPPACDYSDFAELGGTIYYHVADGKFDTWSEWEEYILGTYCGGLAEAALSADTVVCIDGKTYSDGGSKGYDFSDNYTYEIVSSNVDAASVVMHNPSADPDDEYSKETSYSFRLTADGWRIESR